MHWNRRTPARKSVSQRLLVQPLEDRTVPTAWSDLTTIPQSAGGATSLFNLSHERPLSINTTALRTELAAAPALADVWSGAAAPLQFELPRPDGTTMRFGIADAPVMEPGLAAKYPLIKSYAGVGIDDPSVRVRMDISPYGFNAVVIGDPRGPWFVAPFYHLQDGPHISYYQSDVIVSSADMAKLTGSLADSDDDLGPGFANDGGGSGSGGTGGAPPVAGLSSGTQLRTYRIAIAATGEYTRDNGGSVSSALAAIVTTLDQINAIYENDFSIHLSLIANNDKIIYTSGASDPYTNDDKNKMLGENQANLDSVIGSANYDLGHVFSSLLGGGVAGLGVVGNASRKGQGTSSYVDFIPNYMGMSVVPHEIGHQFNANHTFNSANDQSNRNGSTAYEPGSGSTIMSYAGLISGSPDDNYLSGNNPQFNHSAIDEVINFVDNVIPGVGTRTATGNSIPAVSGPANTAIPANTPFELTATASDGNNDALTYSWEEHDLGAANLYTDPDNGASPVWRVFPPTTDPSRSFRKLGDVINGTATAGEQPFTQNRNSTFRVIVRDNRIGAGAVNEAEVKLTVVDTGAPFSVVSPNTAVSWLGKTTQIVSWNVAGTNANGINAANVRIRLSLDGGLTYPITILNSTPNDGSEFITVPNVTTSLARIRVEGVGSVFYDISNANFSIAGVAGVTVTPTNGLVTTEAGGTATFTVVLDIAPSGNVTIPLSSSDGNEGTVSPTSLVFTSANWNIPRTVTVTGVDDPLLDGDKLYTIVTGAATSSDSRYSNFNAADVSVTNLNDDFAGFGVTPVSGLVTTERGGTASFTVQLLSKPTGLVTIPVASNMPSEGTASTTSLTFDATDWDVPKTVIVTGVDDSLVDADKTYTIVLGAATSTDTSYQNLNPPDVSLINWNDDTSVTVVALGPTNRYRQSNGFSATVQGTNGRSVNGTVTITSGALNLGTFPVVNGVASTTTTLLPIGANIVTATFSADTFFQPSSGSTNTTILPALLTVQASAASKVYGAAVPTLLYSASGFVDGEGVGVFTGTLATTGTSASNVGNYPISLGTLSAGPKYEIAFTGSQLGVTTAPLTIAASPVSKVYGAAVPSLPFTPSGFVNSDTVAIITGTLITTATSASSVGQYAIQKGSISAGLNYAVTYVSASLTVTPAPLLVTPDDQTKQYGPAPVPALTYTPSGLVNGDTAAVLSGGLSTTATATSVVGEYPIAQGTLAAGKNYTLSVAAAKVVVTPAPLTVTATSLSSRLGAPIPTFDFTLDGLVNNDAPAVVSGISLTTSATVDSVRGTYPIVVAGGTAANYTLTRVNGTLTLTLLDALVGATHFTVGTNGGSPIATEYEKAGKFVNSFNPFGTSVRTATGDVNGDGTPDVAFGTGPGVLARVRVVDGATGDILLDLLPFGDFTGGVFVTLGDLSGDKMAELVVTPDVGGGPRVSIYRGGDFIKMLDFFGIDDINFRGGARTALGDINGDGATDLVIAAGSGGGPRISIRDGKQLANNDIHGFLTPDFFAFSDSLRDGVYVAAGDVDGDGFAELAVGAGPGGAPRVLLLSGKKLISDGPYVATRQPVANFFAGDPTQRNGVFLSLRNLDEDAYSDLVIGTSGTAVGYRGKALKTGVQQPMFTIHQNDAGPLGGIFVG
jgi:hypothetical protein